MITNPSFRRELQCIQAGLTAYYRNKISNERTFFPLWAYNECIIIKIWITLVIHLKSRSIHYLLRGFQMNTRQKHNITREGGKLNRSGGNEPLKDQGCNPHSMQRHRGYGKFHENWANSIQWGRQPDVVKPQKKKKVLKSIYLFFLVKLSRSRINFKEK